MPSRKRTRANDDAIFLLEYKVLFQRRAPYAASMKSFAISTTLMACTLTVLVGCKKPTSGAPDTSSAPAATSAAPATGLRDPSNRKDIVALAESALACEWNESSGFDEAKCPALAAWTKSEVVQAPEADATLLAMLADDRDPVRWLAGNALARQERPARTDASSAKKLLEAALREPKPLVARMLGGAAALSDLEATGLESQVRGALVSGSSVELRAGLASHVLKVNPKLFDVVLQLARTAPDPTLRSSSIWGLRLAPDEKLPEVHALWLARADDSNDEVVTEVYLRCSVYTACRPIWDGLLAKMEQRKKMLPATVSLLAAMLRETTDKSKRGRLVKLATRIVEDEKQDAVVRTMALQALAEAKEPAAQTLAKTHQSSSELLLGMTAKEILEAAGADASADASPK